jgi:hypothetical protein
VLDGGATGPTTYALLRQLGVSSAERRGLYDPDGMALGQRTTIVPEEDREIRIQVRPIKLDRIHFHSDHQPPP